MKPWIKVLIVTLVVGIPAFLLGPVLFQPAEGGPTPTPGQIPYSILLAVWDAVLFGLGVSFLLVVPAGLEELFGGLGVSGADVSDPPPFGPAEIEQLLAAAPKYGLEVPPPPGA